MEETEVTRIVIGAAINVHRVLGPGFLESVYQKALAHELSKAGVEVQCEKRVQVRYDGALVGDFVADMLVQNSVLIENKAIQTLNKAHEVQLVNYLVATQIEIGLLLNFGTQRLQFKRKSRVYRPINRDSARSAQSASPDNPDNPVHPVDPVKNSSSPR